MFLGVFLNLVGFSRQTAQFIRTSTAAVQLADCVAGEKYHKVAAGIFRSKIVSRLQHNNKHEQLDKQFMTYWRAGNHFFEFLCLSNFLHLARRSPTIDS